MRMKEVGVFADIRKHSSPFEGTHIPGGRRDFTHTCLEHSQLLKE